MADVTAPAATAKAPSVKAKKVTAGKNKKPSIVKKLKTPTYAAVVTKAIQELKEKKGSSRHSIMKHMQGSMEVGLMKCRRYIMRCILRW